MEIEDVVGELASPKIDILETYMRVGGALVVRYDDHTPGGPTRLEIRALKFEVSPNVLAGEKPRRNQITIWLPDNSVYDGPLVSPSQVQTFVQCERKWAWDKIEGLRAPPTKSQILGIKLHAQLEAWLTEGIPPSGTDGSRLIDSGALRAFPTPGTPGLSAEGCFVVQLTWWRDGTAMDPVAPVETVLWGFKDAETLNHVYDLKSTSDLTWAKSSQTLRTGIDEEGHVDIQGALYALAAIADPMRASKVWESLEDLSACEGWEEVAEAYAVAEQAEDTGVAGADQAWDDADHLRASKVLNLPVFLHWVYVQTTGKKLSRLTGGPGGVAMTLSDCVAALVPHLGAIARISSVLSEKAEAKRAPAMGSGESAGKKLLTARAFPVNSAACGSFGGCSHLEKCSSDLSPKAMLSSLFAQDRARALHLGSGTNQAKKEQDMSILARANELRAKQGDKPLVSGAGVAAAPGAVKFAASPVKSTPPAAPAPVKSAVTAAKAPVKTAPAAAAAPAKTAPAAAPAPAKSAMALAAERARAGTPPAAVTPEKVQVTVLGTNFTASVFLGVNSKLWRGEIDGLNVSHENAPTKEVLLTILTAKATQVLAPPAAEAPQEAAPDDGAVDEASPAEAAPEETPPAEVAPAPAPKPKRGRPARAATVVADPDPPPPVEEDLHAVPVDAPAADAPAAVAVADDSDEPFVLYVDVVPLKSDGVVWKDVMPVVEAARQRVEAEAGTRYQLLEFNTGSKTLAAQLLNDLEANPLHGTYFVNSMSLDMPVVQALVQSAAKAWKGVR